MKTIRWSHAPCTFCGNPTARLDVAELCHNCWEVTRRLPEFVRTAKGRKFCQDELKKLGMPQEVANDERQ